ncbi:MAG: biotin/lipoyl-binding protein, partial [Bacteroidota bacterium]
MLNISPNSINNRIPQYRFDSFGKVSVDGSHRSLIRILWIMLTVFVLSTFLPWTQNVRSPGELTSLRPDQRPQSIQSVIAGRIERWYVQEGDYVQTGDTILFLTEVKEKYMDPAFLRRTKQQIEAKKLSAQSYQAKAAATDDQIRALQTIQQLKLKQAKNKYQQARLQVASDSIDFEAAKVAMRIAEAQFKRADTMYQRGIISLVKYEARNNKMQAAQAKRISGENKLLSSRNKLINAQIELSTVENEYRDKLAKSRS